MNTVRPMFRFLAVAIFLVAFASVGYGQATRTWVSGVGDDVNPCSRTAPCKTFAGAISKTAAGGEIDVLDPGGFGAVTITKSITIDGTTGQGFGSILASLTNGVIVNDSLSAAPNTSVVILRNLSINGAPPTSPGLNGVRIIAGKHVSVENCTIFGFLASSAGNGRGISDVRTVAGGTIMITDTIIENNFANGIAILGPITGTIDNVRMNRTTQAGTAALAVDNASAKITVRNSIAANNTGIGLFAGVAGSELNVENCVTTHNGTGVSAGGGTVRVSNTQITNNTTGIGAGTVRTYQNNKVEGNGAGNVFAGGSQINPI